MEQYSKKHVRRRHTANFETEQTRLVRLFLADATREIGEYLEQVDFFSALYAQGQYEIGPNTADALSATALCFLIQDLRRRMRDEAGVPGLQVVGHGHFVDALHTLDQAATAAETLRRAFSGEPLIH